MNINDKTICRVLVVEDDPADASLARQALRSSVELRFEVELVATLSEALQRLQQFQWDVVLLDMSLPDSSGLDTVRAICQGACRLPVIVLTGHDDVNLALKALDMGAQDYLAKSSFDSDRLVLAIRYSIGRVKLEQRLAASEQRYRSLVEFAPFCIHEIDLSGRLESMNHAGLEMMGVEDAKAICGMAYLDAVSSHDRPRIESHLRQAIQGVSSHFEFTGEGEAPLVYKSCFIPIKDEAGDVIKLMGITENITELKKTKARDQLLIAALEAVGNGVMITDKNAHIEWVNSSFLAISGFSREELVGHKPSEMIKSGVHNTDFYHAMWETILQGNVWRGEIVNRHKDGTFQNEEITISPVKDSDGVISNFVGIKHDISERKRSEEKIRHMAQYDVLTDLPNRMLLFDRLRQALAQAKRDQNYLALMYIDFDKFKPINDNLGHAVGDLLLQEAAHRMQKCVRGVDTVARIGGDEFVVLLPVIDNEQDALVVAEKIRMALNKPFELAGKTMNISSSTGIAIYPEHGTSEDEITRNADIAMYFAKEGGRNNVRVFHSGMASRN